MIIKQAGLLACLFFKENNMRKFIFNLHWLCGITAGLVIAIVGFTGGMLSIQPQILTWITPGVITIQAEEKSLSPEALLASIQQQNPNKTISALTLMQENELAAEVRFAPEEGQRRGETQYLNPYTGQLLGLPDAQEFFIDVMRLHRWLLMGDIGKQIVGASTIILILMAVSGIYLRWPKGKKKWQLAYWLKLRKTKSPRAFWWQLHAIIGTWVLPLYLLACLTGLYWSYEWYREGLYTISGVEQPARQRPQNTLDIPSNTKVDLVWNAFKEQNISYREATLHLPISEKAVISYLDSDATHDRETNRISFETKSLSVLNDERFQDKPLNERLMSSMLPLHSGEFFGLTGLILMMIASLIMPLFFITGIYLYIKRKTRSTKRDIQGEII